MVRPPESIIVKLGGREVAVRWSNRALFRLDASPTKVTLEDARRDSGFAFLCVHLWAMLFAEADRRRWLTPESLAESIDIDDTAALLQLWRVVLKEAYNIDPDAPPEDAVVTPAMDAETSPSPSTGPSS